MKRLDTALLALLFAFALLLRVGVAVVYGFDGLYGQDAFAYYDFAAAMAQGKAPGTFFWPLGYPALLTAGFWLFGTSAATAQAISLVLGALLSPMTYILTRQMNGTRSGAFIAGLLLAVCGQALQSSLVVMADIPALAWVTVSALCLWRYLTYLLNPSPKLTANIPLSAHDSPSTQPYTPTANQVSAGERGLGGEVRHAHSMTGYSSTAQMRTRANIRLVWLILCAVTLVLACVTRWLCLIFIPLWGVVYLTSYFSKDEPSTIWQNETPHNASVKPLSTATNLLLRLSLRWGEGFRVRLTRTLGIEIRAMLLVLIVFIPQILYSRSNPYPTLNHAWVEGWSPANAFAHDFTNADGHFSYATVNAVYYARVYTDAYYLAPVWFPLLLLGIFALFYQRQFRKAVFLVGWALLPYLFLAGIPYQNIRFPLIVFPAVAALTGIGISFLLERTQMMRRLAWALAAFVLCLGMWQTYIANRTLIGEFLDNQRRDRESIAWASAQIPEGARVYTLGLTLIMNHYTTFEVYELYYQTPESLETQWIHGEDDYLLVSVWSLRNQWQGREPDIAVRWLIDHRGLVRIDSNERYTIFRING